MVTIERVDEQAAQWLADETRKVTYMSPNWIASLGCRGRMMTTDRDEAVAWGESVAFVPQRRRDLQQTLEQAHEGPSERHVESIRLGANLGELARVTLGERQARDFYLDGPRDKELTAKLTAGEQRAVREYQQAVREFEADPPQQLRVVRVLEYRGEKPWIEATLGNSAVTPIKPFTFGGHKAEIVETTRIESVLCRWCGDDHLRACSEDACGANPAVARHRSGL